MFAINWKKVLLSLSISSVVLLIMSFVMLKLSIYLFPVLTMEYLSPVFRSAGKMDWLYYVHPLIISIALLWFWERYKGIFSGPCILRAFEVALVYGIVAMIPVLWLTFSAIDVSLQMILTWLLYGFIQAFAAGIVFAKLNP
ncbi:hypothetical protein ACFSQD_13405 [Flavihumibacter stibioxidans]|uniref:Uncharacterized protein n=1 Tax=Flavihumibacter stibioxidans TaxID=1834163 RepID=A0ABR7M9Z7_9BACT|nr:hypothetical protein [Flavihumibacter stibioxidans]MBC6491408.1 hypothetical protein [Flavihumibacter stibioxidans]